MNFILNNKFKIIFLSFIILISFYRSPYIFLEGRFMGEEGSHYFKNAYENSFLNQLLYFVPAAGYYNLIANLLTEISTYVPLIYSPLITAYGSLVIILIPSFLILFNESYLFKNDKEKFVGCLIFFITGPHIAEIWANSVNSQIYLFFSSLLILYLKPENKKNQILFPGLLLISGLSAIYSCILTPLFFFKYLYTKQKNYLINTIILAFCSFIQGTLILYSKFTGQLYSSVTNTLLETNSVVSPNMDKIINFFYNFFAKPIIGRKPVYFIYENFGLKSLGASLGQTSMLLLFILLFIIILSLLIKSRFIQFCLKDHIFKSLVIVYILVLMVVIFGADNAQTSGRYAAIPGVLFLIKIYYLATNFPSKIFSKFFSILIVISIISGVYEFRPSTKNVRVQYIKYLDCIDCPRWKSDVEKWKKDENSFLHVWPYPKKRFKLVQN